MTLNAYRKRLLTPLEIFKRFAADTILTAGIYALLVGATLVLRYFASLLKESAFHYRILETLEGGIFISGTTIAGTVLIYVTMVTANDLVRSLGRALRTQGDEGQDEAEHEVRIGAEQFNADTGPVLNTQPLAPLYNQERQSDGGRP